LIAQWSSSGTSRCTTLISGKLAYEEPDAHHGVSANASQTEPARLLAVFVVDTDEKNLTTAE
jgi:quercetin dioxygenase-like cupin family protein